MCLLSQFCRLLFSNLEEFWWSVAFMLSQHPDNNILIFLYFKESLMLNYSEISRNIFSNSKPAFRCHFVFFNFVWFVVLKIRYSFYENFLIPELDFSHFEILKVFFHFLKLFIFLFFTSSLIYVFMQCTVMGFNEVYTDSFYQLTT